ncbi:ABC transporter ATP-binding protein [Phenylobacterium sp.]|uniref:ABC transporter ATP-binding protein n=1 Tax=Phenylobacterium sp. TaxID=1871053 RepID=UPI002FD9F31C
MSLSAADLCVRLAGRPILNELSLELAPGQVTAIVGPNGAGKSTLLACLAGLRRPATGQVRLAGEAILAMNIRQRARKLAFLEQSPEVAWAVDVRTLVGLGRTPYLGASGLGDEDAAAVDDAMRLTGVEAFAGRLVPTLSGGERARVLIARALAGDPQWLLADEPLAGLDPGHQLDALQLFRRLAGDGRGIVVTIHDLTLAARAADRIIVLHQGRILADGPPGQALAPQVLAQAYGVEAVLSQGAGGVSVEVVRRLG